MKNATEILEHLLSSPSFDKLRKLREINYFIRMLPLSIKSGIAFGYIRDDILFLTLKHPYLKQEFYHKIAWLRQLLKQCKEEKNVLLEVKDIKYFVTNNVYKKEVEKKKEEEIPLYYGELSTGDFENEAKDEEIHKIFEDIREIILKNIENGL